MPRRTSRSTTTFRRWRRNRRPWRSTAREIAAEYDAVVDTEVKIGRPARVIVETVADYDTVVLGSHSGRLSDRLFIGNVAEKVVRGSPVPVTVVR